MTDTTEKKAAGGSGGPALTAQIEALTRYDQQEFGPHPNPEEVVPTPGGRWLKRSDVLTLVGAGTVIPPPSANLPSDEVLLKAMKLLEALSEPCTTGGGEDHSWRLCRRCMAIRQFDFAPDVTRILVDRVLAALKSSALPPAAGPQKET